MIRRDQDHREEFSHPGDPDYHSSDNHLQKRKCRYGEDCFRFIILFLVLFNKSILLLIELIFNIDKNFFIQIIQIFIEPVQPILIIQSNKNVVIETIVTSMFLFY